LEKINLTDGLHPSVSNSSKCVCFHLSLIEAFLICPDLIEAVVPAQMLLFYSNISKFT